MSLLIRSFQSNGRLHSPIEAPTFPALAGTCQMVLTACELQFPRCFPVAPPLPPGSISRRFGFAAAPWKRGGFQVQIWLYEQKIRGLDWRTVDFSPWFSIVFLRVFCRSFFHVKSTWNSHKFSLKFSLKYSLKFSQWFLAILSLTFNSTVPCKGTSFSLGYFSVLVGP